MKRNKIRYQSKTKEKILITLTGRVYLRHRDEEAIAQARKGDLLVYPKNVLLEGARLGEYESVGFAGYFKVDAHDGKEWRLVLLNEIFPHNEHHFAKRERPIDAYELCAEILRARKGTSLRRVYREHYEPETPPQDEA